MASQKTKLYLIVVCILAFIISTSAQTFQYSKGWEPGRKRADERNSYPYRDWDAERKRDDVRGLGSRMAWQLALKRSPPFNNQAEFRELMSRIASE